MFKHLNTTLIALGCILTFTGCIHKDYPPCEPLKVNLVVANKNYVNVADIEEEEAVDERLPFHSYIPTMCYLLRDAQTGEVVERSGIVETSKDNLEHTITFSSDLPHGTYDLIVWGGIKSMAALDFDNDPTTAAFHTSSYTDEDIYLGHGTVVYGPFETVSDLQMKRTMGKLIIIKKLVGKAKGVTRSKKVITDLRNYVDADNNYNASQDVTFERTFSAAEQVISKTVLAPSVVDSKTKFHIEFYNDDPETKYPKLVPDDVRINIHPNELVVLRYVYNPELEKFDISVKINNGWQNIFNLDLED